MTTKVRNVDGYSQIAAIIAAGGVGAIVAVLVNAIYRGGADAGDWLQFFGGVLGAALAVFGTIFLERRKKLEEDRRQRNFLRAVISDIQDDFRVLDAAPRLDATNLQDMAAHLLSVQSRMEGAVAAVNAVPVSSLPNAKVIHRAGWMKNEALRAIERITKFREDYLDGKASAGMYVALMNNLEVQIGTIEGLKTALGPTE